MPEVAGGGWAASVARHRQDSETRSRRAIHEREKGGVGVPSSRRQGVPAATYWSTSLLHPSPLASAPPTFTAALWGTSPQSGVSAADEAQQGEAGERWAGARPHESASGRSACRPHRSWPQRAKSANPTGVGRRGGPLHTVAHAPSASRMRPPPPPDSGCSALAAARATRLS